jgi:hypothetical protein
MLGAALRRTCTIIAFTANRLSPRFAVGMLLVLGWCSVSAHAATPHPRDAIIEGSEWVCGGTYPGGCRPGGVGSCPNGAIAPSGCYTTDRVAVIDGRGRVVAQRWLSNHGFAVRVPPGAYVVELLADRHNGRPTPGKVVQQKSVTAYADRISVVRFTFYVP